MCVYHILISHYITKSLLLQTNKELIGLGLGWTNNLTLVIAQNFKYQQSFYFLKKNYDESNQLLVTIILNQAIKFKFHISTREWIKEPRKKL